MDKYTARPTTIEAAEIEAIELLDHGMTARLALADGSIVRIALSRGTHAHPKVGDYLIHLAEHNDTYVCPRAVFMEKYTRQRNDGLTFGDAIELLKLGAMVARAGWNGKGMWIGLHQEGGEFVREDCGTALTYRDYIVMKTVDDQLVPWTASQTDVLADDWVVVE